MWCPALQGDESPVLLQKSRLEVTFWRLQMCVTHHHPPSLQTHRNQHQSIFSSLPHPLCWRPHWHQTRTARKVGQRHSSITNVDVHIEHNMLNRLVSPPYLHPATSTRLDTCVWQHMEVHSVCCSLGTMHLHAHCSCHKGALLVQALPQLPPSTATRRGWGRRVNRLLGNRETTEPSDIHLRARQRADRGRGGGWVFWGSVHQEGRVTCGRGDFSRTMKKQSSWWTSDKTRRKSSKEENLSLVLTAGP